MKVICIDEPALYELVNQVVNQMKQSLAPSQEKWVTPAEAMKILGIKSKTTLQKLRNEGLIRYSQPDRRIILYDVQSLYNYLEAYAQEPFGAKYNGSR